ncbi:multidrug effflux MFS transporter [Loktanella sp. IMCC34160]|uniref:multidrug effflux MFS transporter n=1 Tax=Loktanella sp. IMCC34160 TaxID=2510646 RepID=UPI001F5E17A0|nr:multidrug effflux MFS transporter [Loktanella sp. IMCC34160]
MAMMGAMVAFSIDAMLPALPEIGAELSPDALNRAQLVVTSLVLGMGVGTFFVGPISDAVGRRPVVIGGTVIYIGAALSAYWVNSLEGLLISRVIMGLGASGARVMSIAIVRDKFEGRQMARITSFVMLVFALVPALAPSLGALIIVGWGWRAVFLSFAIFALVICLWYLLRQPETLHPEYRRPLSFRAMGAALREMAAHPTVRLSTVVQTLCFGMLFSVLSSTQQVFDITFDQGAAFPLWFGAIAVIAASGSVINARLVVRLGMRAMVKGVLVLEIGLSALMILGWLLVPGTVASLALYVLWTASVFFMVGLTIGNLTALALEPMGHIAGIAASALTAIATVGAVLIAVPVGLAFDGTPLPLAIGVLCAAIPALWLTTKIRRDSDG